MTKFSKKSTDLLSHIFTTGVVSDNDMINILFMYEYLYIILAHNGEAGGRIRLCDETILTD